MTTGQLGVGFIGTVNISSAYLRAITGHENMAGFPVLDIKGLADMRPEASGVSDQRRTSLSSPAE